MDGVWLEVLGVVGFVGLALLGLHVVRTRVPLEVRREQHDVAAACFAVIGGLYGIILAFVLVSSWQRFDEARAKAELEANAVADLYRHAKGFPEPTRSALKDHLRAYAHSVIEQEWVAMADGREDPATQAVYDQIWRLMLDAPAQDDRAVALYQNSLAKLDDFSDARRTRLLYARVSLPGIVWAFLIGSGFLTVCFSYFFGLRQVASQMIMTASLALTIAAALVLIEEMQKPFSGGVRVGPYAFTQFVEASRRGPSHED